MTEPLAGDTRTRAAELYERFAAATHARLVRWYRGVDPHRLADAVLRLSGLQDTHPPNVSRALTEFARQRIRVHLRGELRRKHREVRSTPVGETLSVADRELAERVRDQLADTPAERHALDCWLAGVTRPDEVAVRLGVPEADAVTLLARLRQRMHRLRAKVTHDP